MLQYINVFIHRVANAIKTSTASRYTVSSSVQTANQVIRFKQCS